MVACKDNSKVGGYSDGCAAGSGGYKVGVVVWVFGFGWGWVGRVGRERTPTRALPR